MEPIALSDTFRVNDYDSQQYTIEQRVTFTTGNRAGQTIWMPVAYCGSVKSLPSIARRVIGDDAATQSKKAAEKAFDASGMADQLAALPAKATAA